MWFIIVFTIILAVLTWLLITPLQLQIDTTVNHYRLQWKTIGYGQLVVRPAELAVRLKVLFWQKEWPLFPPKSKTEKEKPQSKQIEPKKQQSQKAKRRSFAKLNFRSLLHTFEVKRFRLHLDTDDFIVNSYIFPIFYLLRREDRDLQINYKGEALLQLVVENRLYRILFAFLRFR
ncbi:MAG: hypothetical protein AAFP77_16380 [Bacteroidota bacterium]